MAKAKEMPWFNQAQKEGLAKIIDGLVLAAILALVSYITDRLALAGIEAILLVIIAPYLVFHSLYLRKE